MTLEFMGSPEPSLGVEIELQILDAKTLDLTPQSELLIRKSKEAGLERIKSEVHQSMLEIDSEISQDVKQCRSFLTARAKRLSGIADELGLELAVAGTHPFQRWTDRLFCPEERYLNLHSRYRWLARRMNVYGLHVHVGVKSGELALAISNALVRYLPHLLALSANSPFWQGMDTGMNSSRINIMDSFPFSGIPQQFKRWSEFEHYYHTLSHAGVISSLKDLYWHIRPNLGFGTVEFRICDAMSSLDETMSVVALIQCLVDFSSESLQSQTDDWLWSQEQQWISPENQWIAARDGLNGIIITGEQGKRQKISESILELIEKLFPTAKKLNCYEELQYVAQIVAKGNGARRQREIFTNTQSFQEVVMNAIHEFKSCMVPGVC